ncbi:MAG: hypothetical protein ACOYN5_01390 [Bacteroidales bacterium]
METDEKSNQENKPTTRLQRMLAAQERMNKVHNVSPEFMETVNNLFRSPVMVIPISFSKSAKKAKENPKEKKSKMISTI